MKNGHTARLRTALPSAAVAVGGRGSNPEPNAFFSHIFKFCSQNASSASGNEVQQRKKAVKERRGC
jgi:hypothetical protein